MTLVTIVVVVGSQDVFSRSDCDIESRLNMVINVYPAPNHRPINKSTNQSKSLSFMHLS